MKCRLRKPFSRLIFQTNYSYLEELLDRCSKPERSSRAGEQDRERCSETLDGRGRERSQRERESSSERERSQREKEGSSEMGEMRRDAAERKREQQRGGERERSVQRGRAAGQRGREIRLER